ncbi:uncharacterized protein MAM_03059 [Metarhizium album ARSEF 1941]|uniref:AA1-like domain-containing protein n=1 Tax=Metarhizium album (strain ARSEF 1941) TaxID=1081103 RepID=A0A0B2WTG1_METAS|nr:uncharacterized protein MAM_03059 [Metarhizium album ARSEF 1941]KHN99361.1 hypothetical protein MAM_03059 [Metarhizium album ARSEF 1941]
MVNLLTSLLLAGAALAAPSTPDLRTGNPCTEKSARMENWQVKDFDFHASYIFTTPAHQNSWGYVNFTLLNPSFPSKPTQCSGTSNQLSDFFYGNFNYDCSRSWPGQSASFAFSRPEQDQLKVNQTWECRGEGSRFWAEGGLKLNLTCDDATWTNPDWKMGQIYSDRTVNCTHIDATVPVETMRAIA